MSLAGARMPLVGVYCSKLPLVDSSTKWMAGLIVLFLLGFLQVGSVAAESVPTFAKDVAPILFKNCVKCHQTGELASKVPLTSYEMVRPRAKSIKQMVMTREMPPWPADPARSLKFRNDP